MRRVILAIAATAVGLVLLLTFKTSTQPAASGSAPAAALGRPTPGSAGSASGAGTAGAGTGRTAGTVTGAAWPTIYGPVQVRITVSGGRISAVTATEYPDGLPRDAQINAYAIPKLNAEALTAGSAHIDTVSGATYTSQGYVGSLQNALDKAGRGKLQAAAATSAGSARRPMAVNRYGSWRSDTSRSAGWAYLCAFSSASAVLVPPAATALIVIRALLTRTPQYRLATGRSMAGKRVRISVP
jgi:uncharacterized protein with FMN-binding domain